MDNEKPKKSSIGKTIAVGAIAGLLGGGASYAGLSQIQSMNGNVNQPKSTVVESNNKGNAKIENTSNKSTNGEMTGAFNKVSKSVVSVVNLQKQKDNGDDFASIFGGRSGSGDNSNSDSNSGKLEEYSEGSGVIYDNSNGKGYIVTNNHVVAGSDKLQVILSDGTKLDAKLVGTDAETDLAVLTIDGSKVPAVSSFGSSKNIMPGQTVIAIGSPLGSEYATSVTQGIISAANRTLTVQDESGRATGQTTVIQTDAAINPGNSGGPLVNADGQVIGINSMKLSTSGNGTTVEGMGFAIPSDEVVTIINQLVKNGKITRPALGIRVASVSEIPDASRTELKISKDVKDGVFVASVNKDSVAEKAGMKPNDVIFELNGKKVTDVVSLHSELYSHKVGDKVSVKVNRDGKEVDLNVTL